MMKGRRRVAWCGGSSGGLTDAGDSCGMEQEEGAGQAGPWSGRATAATAADVAKAEGWDLPEP